MRSGSARSRLLVGRRSYLEFYDSGRCTVEKWVSWSGGRFTGNEEMVAWEF